MKGMINFIAMGFFGGLIVYGKQEYQMLNMFVTILNFLCGIMMELSEVGE